LRPEFLGDMRREGREHLQEHLPVGLLGNLVNAVDVNHHGADGRVELEVLDVVRDLLDGLVEAGLESWRRLSTILGVGRDALAVLPPDFVEEAVEPDDALRVPRLGLLEFADEHLEEPGDVGAVVADDLVWVDDVAARLRHLLAVLAHDEPLVAERLEGLGELEIAKSWRTIVRKRA